MVGDYISTSFVNGVAYPFFANATAPTGSTFNEGLFTASGVAVVAGSALASDVDNSNPHPALGADNAWNATANEAHNGSARD